MTRADLEAGTRRSSRMSAGTNKKLDLFFIGVAKDDPVYPRAKELSETLTSHGIVNQLSRDHGGHTYPVWRKLLVETAPLLFRKSVPAVSD